MRSIAVGDRWWLAARASTNLAAVVGHASAHASQAFKSFHTCSCFATSTVAKRHEPRLLHFDLQLVLSQWLILIKSLPWTTTDSSSTVALGAPNVRVASHLVLFHNQFLVVAMARVGWSLGTRHISGLHGGPPRCPQPPRHDFHRNCQAVPRTTGRQTTCLSP